MKIQIESTSKIVKINAPDGGEIPARIWEGTTERGIPVHAYITLLSCDSTADASEFEAELKEVAIPSAAVAALPSAIRLTE